MSYNVTTFAVDVAGLRAIAGCRDSVLRSSILQSHEEDVRSNTAWFQHRIDDGAPTLDRALADLMDGRVLVPRYAFQYVYAFELLCKHYGERLPNEPFQSIHFEFLDLVEWALEETGVSLLEIISGGPPFPCPRPDNSPPPLVGHLNADRVRPTLDSLANVDGRRRGAPRRPRLRRPATDADLAAAIENVRSWLKRASERGWGLVCFYY